jgi:hypothetical protein
MRSARDFKPGVASTCYPIDSAIEPGLYAHVQVAVI